MAWNFWLWELVEVSGQCLHALEKKEVLDSGAFAARPTTTSVARRPQRLPALRRNRSGRVAGIRSSSCSSSSAASRGPLVCARASSGPRTQKRPRSARRTPASGFHRRTRPVVASETTSTTSTDATPRAEASRSSARVESCSLGAHDARRGAHAWSVLAEGRNHERRDVEEAITQGLAQVADLILLRLAKWCDARWDASDAHRNPWGGHEMADAPTWLLAPRAAARGSPRRGGLE